VGSPATQQNLKTLAGRGAAVIDPAAGTLVCGEVGVGKLAPVPAIIEAIEAALVVPKRDLAGVKVLITAGPTTSPIDAVRYITNHSTGRMGAAMAEEALRRGAQVRYVLRVDKGVVRPTAPKGSADRLTLVEVRTAEEMAAAALNFLPDVNGIARSPCISPSTTRSAPPLSASHRPAASSRWSPRRASRNWNS
jgi:phosphopantothenoylcysteine decarboxylase/phosphopantothenate--cysteine ligase